MKDIMKGHSPLNVVLVLAVVCCLTSAVSLLAFRLYSFVEDESLAVASNADSSREHAESFDWEVSGDSPILGQEIPVKNDMDVPFRDGARGLEGDGLWQVAVFGSSHSKGDGPRFREVTQILKNKADTYLRKGDTIDFDSIQRELDIRIVRCIENVNYVCMEFLKVDAPTPDLTLIVESGSGDETRDSMIFCKLQECGAGVIAEIFDWEMSGESPIFGQEIPVKDGIDAQFRDGLEGDGLWRVAVFGSSNSEGDGPRFREVTQILKDDKAYTYLRKGDPIDFDSIQRKFDIGILGCIEDVNYVCMEFLKGDPSDPEFTLAVESGSGDETGNSKIICKPQKCGTRVKFTELEAFLLPPALNLGNTGGTDTSVPLKRKTLDKDFTTTKIITRRKKTLNRQGVLFREQEEKRRINEQPQFLSEENIWNK